MVRSTVPLRKYVMLARIICINISHIRRKIMFVNRFFFQLFDTFRQGSCKALPFSTRQLHSGGATQAFSSQVPTSGCNSLNLLQIVNSRFSYTSTMPLSQLAGRNILQWSCPVLRQPVTHQLCRSEISNQLQGNSAWGYTCVRTKVRCYFPRQSEVKRIKKHGLRARLSTAAGRRIIMSRLLKGRHVLSH